MADDAELEQSAVESVVPQVPPMLFTKAWLAKNKATLAYGQHHHHKSSSNNNSWLAASLVLNCGLLLAMLWGPALQGAAPGSAATAAGVFTNGTLTDSCSGHGFFKQRHESPQGACECNPCFRGTDCSQMVTNCVINLDHGDPKMYEAHWQQGGQESAVTILGWHKMSYFADSKHFFFVEKDLEQQIRALHKVVGNAVTQGRHIVVGTGSTQLLQAALYALAPENGPPISVVSQVPYYSCYHTITTFLKSGLYRWQGDAPLSPDEPYIELVASPNNPDGNIRHGPPANSSGVGVFDLAYYWPQYTPIPAPIDRDLMLFTVSKATGHAGTRIGWAIVKDEAVAKKMAYFVEVNSIGVSQDAQVRATQLLRVVVRSAATQIGTPPLQLTAPHQILDPHFLRQDMFHYGYSVMDYRWRLLRDALQGNKRFRLPQFAPGYCSFFGQVTQPAPAFLWLECIVENDCNNVLREGGILTRSGDRFGAHPRFVRISMVDRSDSFELFAERLASLSRALTS